MTIHKIRLDKTGQCRLGERTYFTLELAAHALEVVEVDDLDVELPEEVAVRPEGGRVVLAGALHIKPWVATKGPFERALRHRRPFDQQGGQ